MLAELERRLECVEIFTDAPLCGYSGECVDKMAVMVIVLKV
jgi:hypothetical protein